VCVHVCVFVRVSLQVHVGGYLCVSLKNMSASFFSSIFGDTRDGTQSLCSLGKRSTSELCSQPMSGSSSRVSEVMDMCAWREEFGWLVFLAKWEAGQHLQRSFWEDNCSFE
jgi:hypothetical protein